MSQPLLKNRVLSGIKWLGLAKASSQAVRWVTTIFVIRLLDSEDYGLAALAILLPEYLAIFTNMGLGTAIVRNKTITQNDLRAVFSVLLIANMLLALVQWLAAPYIAHWYKQEELQLLIHVLSLSYLFYALDTIPTAIIQREMRFRDAAVGQLISTTLASLATFTLAYLGYGVWALICQSLVLLSTQMLCNLFYCRRYDWLIPSLNLKAATPMLQFGGLVMLTSVVWIIFSSVDVAIAGLYWSAAELGMYAVALNLSVMIVSKVMTIIQTVALPAFSEIQEDKQLVKTYFMHAVSSVLLLSVPISYGMAATADAFIPILLGEKWAASAQIVAILCLGLPLRLLIEMCSPILRGIGLAKVDLRNFAFLALAMALLVYLGVSYGPIGVAAAWIGIALIIILIPLRLTCKALDVSYVEVLLLTLKHIGSGLLMVGIVVYLIDPVLALSPIARLVILVLSGGLLYGAMGLLWFRPELTRTLSFIRR